MNSGLNSKTAFHTCDGTLTCYGSIAWRNRTCQRATWRACAVRAH